MDSLLDSVMDRIEPIISNIKANPVIWTTSFLVLLIVSAGLLTITIVSMVTSAPALIGLTIMTVVAFGIFGLAISHEVAEDLVKKVQKR